MILSSFFSITIVAVTNLFPLTNQCPRQRNRPHIDQSGAERIDSSFPLELFFLALFGSHDKSEREPCLQRRHTSLASSATDIPHGRPSLKSTLLLATHTEEPALRSVTHTSYKLKDQHTIR